MVQAARSGVANVIEGSEASATSKKTELKLTNVAKASQEELLTDYQAFLRQRGLPEWPADSPAALRVRAARPDSLEALRTLMAALVSDRSDRSDGGTPKSTRSPAQPGEAPQTVPTATFGGRDAIKAEVAGNVMICLINQETFLLGRQVARLAADFEHQGGFTERLYRVRTEAREKSDRSDKSDKSDKSDD